MLCTPWEISPICEDPSLVAIPAHLTLWQKCVFSLLDNKWDPLELNKQWGWEKSRGTQLRSSLWQWTCRWCSRMPWCRPALPAFAQCELWNFFCSPLADAKNDQNLELQTVVTCEWGEVQKKSSTCADPEGWNCARLEYFFSNTHNLETESPQLQGLYIQNTSCST